MLLLSHDYPARRHTIQTGIRKRNILLQKILKNWNHQSKVNTETVASLQLTRRKGNLQHKRFHVTFLQRADVWDILVNCPERSQKTYQQHYIQSYREMQEKADDQSRSEMRLGLETKIEPLTLRIKPFSCRKESTKIGQKKRPHFILSFFIISLVNIYKFSFFLWRKKRQTYCKETST